MLFLKQLRVHGFKSFANPVVLDFTHNMIGIVGPNGSGKSNITDAIRWALGEQSTKSLRGSSLDDIVFSGNPNHESINLAKVTLVFDNSSRTFKSLDDELVEITRQFNKKTRESNFYVNQRAVRLREVQELALETGLTRSSMAIISQGMVTQFAEAKPENRRDIFDEAIGMAKYKKRKREAQQKLVQARENYNRLNDLAHEIGLRLPNLKKQATKAQLYQEKISSLKEFELSILKLDVHNFYEQLKQINQEVADKNLEAQELTRNLENCQLELHEVLTNAQDLDLQINQSNRRFQDILNDLTQSQVQHKEFEAREMNQIEFKDLDKFKIKNLKRRYQDLIVEQESKSQKVRDLSQFLDEARRRLEYIAGQYHHQEKEVEELNRRLYQLNYDYQRLKLNQTQLNPTYNLALQSLLAHKKNLPGVIDSLINLLEVEPDFQIALSAGAGGNLLGLVTENTQATKKAIEFLKQNKNGRVTFLPLDNLSPSRISGSIRNFIVEQPGFIGFANDLARVHPNYQVACDYVLGHLIVMANYDLALNLTKATNQSFNVVTLAGEKFLPRGAIVGGSYRHQNLFSSLEVDKRELELRSQNIKNLEGDIQKQTRKLHDLRTQKNQAQEEVAKLQDQKEQLEYSQVKMGRELEFIDEEFQLLNGTSLKEEGLENLKSQSPLAKLNQKISDLLSQRDETQSEINRLSLLKGKSLTRQELLNSFNQRIQNTLLPLQKEIGKLEGEKDALENNLDGRVDLLVKKYQLTLENVLESPRPTLVNENEVRSLIEKLSEEITQLGNVNLVALEEYPQEQERFDYYQQQLQDIITSINQMEEIIHQIDEEMETQFHQIIQEVNRVLPQAFKKMFGGGHAELTFDQPENLLETGIDIKVNPPGKKITNLNLLSGGEKSLVALSVLFSLLQVHPLPLVILDEAEAPLDPANVERFALYIKEFTQLTQFIVVTHREGTMANCDVLFGVTMQTPGITKMVKIELHESSTYLPPASI